MRAAFRSPHEPATDHEGEPAFRIAAVKILLDHLLDDRSEKTVLPLVEKVAAALGKGVAVEVIPHTELKEQSHEVKTIVRTGDFTAWGNVLLVSGAGPRWTVER